MRSPGWIMPYLSMVLQTFRSSGSSLALDSFLSDLPFISSELSLKTRFAPFIANDISAALRHRREARLSQDAVRRVSRPAAARQRRAARRHGGNPPHGVAWVLCRNLP